MMSVWTRGDTEGRGGVLGINEGVEVMELLVEAGASGRQTKVADVVVATVVVVVGVGIYDAGT